MLALIQLVKKGSVTVDQEIISSIGPGYVILLGIFEEDTEKDILSLAPKIANLRIIPDDDGKMNKSIMDTGGEVLVVSQFTLCADTRKGRRPSFIKAKKPDEAEKLYELFIQKIKGMGIPVRSGRFGARMVVEIINDGPVTILLDSAAE